MFDVTTRLQIGLVAVLILGTIAGCGAMNSDNPGLLLIEITDNPPDGAEITTYNASGIDSQLLEENMVQTGQNATLTTELSPTQRRTLDRTLDSIPRSDGGWYIRYDGTTYLIQIVVPATD